MVIQEQTYNNHEAIKTGTTTLGIVCRDGVVIAADRRATAGHFISNKKTQKVFPVADNVAITIAGLVSDAQLLSKVFRAELKLKAIRAKHTVTAKEAANLLAGMTYENIRRMSMVPSIVGFLLAANDSDGSHLYEIGVDGSIFERDDFCADGSGSVFVYGVLESQYKKDLVVSEGIELAKKSFKASISRDSASGDGFDIFVVDKSGVRKVHSQELSLKE
ncbi:MAG: proteasome subunit beta [Candidatus Woesearchaeota archaeon]